MVACTGESILQKGEVLLISFAEVHEY